MLYETAAIALGLNNSEVQFELTQQIESILGCFTDKEIAKRSSLYKTPAFPNGSGPDFINAIILLKTDLSPDLLLSRLHKIENIFHRERPYRWAPRSCDLDLIFYNNVIMPNIPEFHKYASFTTEQAMANTPETLILPHPRMHERAFVLGPLREIAPEYIHPVYNQTVEEMWQKLPEDQRNEIIKIT